MRKQPEPRRTAIVTGASRGIGPHIARALVQEGMNVVLAARTTSELERVAEELRQSGARALAIPTDIADQKALVALVSAAEDEFGAVDVLVNNASLEPQVRFHRLEPEEIEQIVRIDLVAPLVLARLLLPGMLARGQGHIVNVSSLAGRTSFPFTESYAAAKDGLIAFSRVLRNDYRGTGVSASTVILGAVKGAGLTHRTLAETGLKTNTAFFVTPERVARAVVRAIEKNKAESVVAPGPGRLMKALMDLFPSLGPALNRATGVEQLMASVADHREQSRDSRQQPRQATWPEALEAEATQ